MFMRMVIFFGEGEGTREGRKNNAQGILGRF